MYNRLWFDAASIFDAIYYIVLKDRLQENHAIKFVSFKKPVDISSTHEISTGFLKETDFSYSAFWSTLSNLFWVHVI